MLRVKPNLEGGPHECESVCAYLLGVTFVFKSSNFDDISVLCPAVRGIEILNRLGLGCS